MEWKKINIFRGERKMKIEMDSEEVAKLLRIESTLLEQYKKLRKEFLDFKDLVIEWKRQDYIEIDKLNKELLKVLEEK